MILITTSTLMMTISPYLSGVLAQHSQHGGRDLLDISERGKLILLALKMILESADVQ